MTRKLKWKSAAGAAAILAVCLLATPTQAEINGVEGIGGRPALSL